MNYVGIPVGLALSNVAPGGWCTMSARPEHWIELSRLRWNVPQRGLVLMSAAVHKAPIFVLSPEGPAFELAGDGRWFFPPVKVQASMLVQITVMNLSASPIAPHAIAFWGKLL